jgi:hypothetical protein
MHVLVIVLALGVLGLGAWDVESSASRVASIHQQQA